MNLFAKELVTSSGLLQYPIITVEDGLIERIDSRESGMSTRIDLDYPDCTLTCGFFDVHFHGAVGHDVMNGRPESLEVVSRYLASVGVTKFLPTTVTASMDLTLRALECMADFIETPAPPKLATAAGIHVEGPFLSHTKRGMHPAEYLQTPSPERLDRLWQASRGHLRLMTIAPELPGALETIAHARRLGIRCSMGHSTATRDEALAATEAGVVSATHTFNAMRAYDHRECGILGVVLDRHDLYADLICDGLHVSPEAVRLWFKAKGPERAILITDCLEAAGMPDGVYTLGQTVVNVSAGVCKTEEGVLAGSTITLDLAIENFRKVTGAGLPTASRLASFNPAEMLGLGPMAQPGASADFNLYDAAGKRIDTIVRGLPLGMVQ